MFHSPAGQRAAQSAEIGHIPVQADQPSQALDEPGRLPQRHPEQDFHRQAGLDGSVTVDGLSATLAGGLRSQHHVRIKPALRRLQTIAYRPMDRQRSAALEHFVIRGPVQGSVRRYIRFAHQPQLSRWMALLHKSGDRRISPFPGQTHPTASVTGIPSAVKPFSTATRT
jgi:hypothetical protein